MWMSNEKDSFKEMKLGEKVGLAFAIGSISFLLIIGAIVIISGILG